MKDLFFCHKYIYKHMRQTFGGIFRYFTSHYSQHHLYFMPTQSDYGLSISLCEHFHLRKYSLNSLKLWNVFQVHFSMFPIENGTSKTGVSWTRTFWNFQACYSLWNIFMKLCIETYLSCTKHIKICMHSSYAQKKDFH